MQKSSFINEINIQGKKSDLGHLLRVTSILCHASLFLNARYNIFSTFYITLIARPAALQLYKYPVNQYCVTRHIPGTAKNLI